MSDDAIDKTERERAFAMLEEHVAALGEYFECVQVLVSTSDGEGTRQYHHGQGNIFARESHARLWADTIAEELLNGTGDDD